MGYSNKHLVEVNCGFLFPEETTLWDSTFFGQFYEQIKTQGFRERQERKGVQITFQGNPLTPNISPVTRSEVEDQVIFRNTEKGWAILMGKGKVSFHIVKEYPGWEIFSNELIVPFSEIYRELGLGNGIRQCNVVYLNHITKPLSENLSDYFTIISPLDKQFGNETNTFVQRVVSNDRNLLIAKLNSISRGSELNINLECGAICTNRDCMSSNDWKHQADQTREPIRNFFEAIITEKLRNEL